MTILGLDIGGANIKAARTDGWATSIAFPLWKTPEQLSDALRSIIASAGEVDHLAITMTGELADCFATKAEGVARILAAVQSAADNRQVVVWSTIGTYITVDEARREPFAVAAANWHALATWVGQRFPCRVGLLI
ncbi:MAG TPA: hydantoinase/oxoprolinase family protein, partial [Planctomycetaceae bacterium]|nr:hydantoinase/oxoprolinase family protein [Planctomycetaceae bacterium]